VADPGVPVTKRVDLMIPMRTVLLVAAAIATWHFAYAPMTALADSIQE
jgi:hypothetical protein